MLKSLVGAIALSTLLFAPAHAALVIQTGNHPQTDNNVINGGACGGASGPALSLEACFNGQNTPIVNFLSDENITYVAGGQAKIEAQSGDYSRLKISVDGYTIDSLILNINTNEDGYIRFTDGTTTSAVFALNDNGNNFFTITGGSFDYLSFLTYSNSAGTYESDIVDDVRQVRMDVTETTAAAVSEPATFAILAASLVGLGMMARRRRRRPHRRSW